MAQGVITSLFAAFDIADGSVISSPHPAALRRSALTRRDQGRALLPSLLRYQVPIWPERLLTRDNAAEIERLLLAIAEPGQAPLVRSALATEMLGATAAWR